MADEPEEKQNRLSRIRSFVGSKISDVQSTDFNAIREETLTRIFEPERFRDEIEKASTASQVIALFVLPFFIMLSLPLMVVSVQIGEDVLTIYDASDPSSGALILQFMITLVGLAIFSVTAWLWFMFVRTAGFGMFEID